MLGQTVIPFWNQLDAFALHLDEESFDVISRRGKNRSD